jgi:3-hydroxybutyryl-CoA dehydrogenase
MTTDGAVAAGGWPTCVAILGAGTMGAGFSHVFGLAGIEVAIADESPEAASSSLERLVGAARRYEHDGLFPAGATERVQRSVRAATSIADAVDGADYVLEAVTENPAVKRAVYEQVDAVAGAETIVASNTSAIPIAQLAEHVRRPERFLGTHWFNPPQWVPCVEIIPAPQTDPAVVEQVRALHARLGKQPVVVGDGPGFVANRIQFAMFKEAVSVVADGLATAEAVDEVVRGSFGFRLPFFGPFAIADMAGLDVYAGAYDALASGLGERLTCPPEVQALVDAGRTGAKSGAGFMDWPETRRAGVIAGRDTSYAALGSLLRDPDAARTTP